MLCCFNQQFHPDRKKIFYSMKQMGNFLTRCYGEGTQPVQRMLNKNMLNNIHF